MVNNVNNSGSLAEQELIWNILNPIVPVGNSNSNSSSSAQALQGANSVDSSQLQAVQASDLEDDQLKQAVKNQQLVAQEQGSSKILLPA